MKAAIVTFSIKGALLGIKISEIIKQALDNNAITNDKVENICDDTIEDSRAAGIELVTTNERAANIVPKLTVSLSDWVETQFVSCDLLVFVGACGIAVRKIAPFIKDKKSDPAVLVVDDMGGNVISLLSGHIGNANAWTCLVADRIGANPVITTASDCHGKIAIDMFAVNNGLVITDFTLAKDIESALLDGEKIRLIIDEDCAVKLAGDVPEEFINIENEISENSRETDNSCKNILDKVETEKEEEKPDKIGITKEKDKAEKAASVKEKDKAGKAASVKEKDKAEKAASVKEKDKAEKSETVKNKEKTEKDEIEKDKDEIVKDKYKPEKSEIRKIILKKEENEANRTVSTKSMINQIANQTNKFTIRIGIKDSYSDLHEENDELMLVPRNIVLGVGCRRGKEKQEIVNMIRKFLRLNNISEKAIFTIASIDLKKDEEGLILAAEEFNAKTRFFSADELGKVESVSESSEFVKKITGVDNVCERAAILGSDFGRLICTKYKEDGVTVAAAIMERSISFE